MIKEEILDLVDEDDIVIGQATRTAVREKALLHRIAKIIIVNKNGEFLIHKRSNRKDIFPFDLLWIKNSPFLLTIIIFAIRCSKAFFLTFCLVAWPITMSSSSTMSRISSFIF